MTQYPAGAAAGVQLATPAYWWDLPLDPSTRDQEIAALIDERTERYPALAESRSEVTALLRQLASEAADLGAVFSSQFGLLGDEPPLAGNLLVVTERPAPSPIDSLLGQVQGLEDSLASRTVGQPEVGLVELPLAGPAVRRRARQSITFPGADAGIDAVLVQYYVPIPSTDAVALMTFTSPSVQQETAVVELFDAVAATFSFLDEHGEALTRDT